jgi:hypothetical protein
MLHQTEAPRSPYPMPEGGKPTVTVEISAEQYNHLMQWLQPPTEAVRRLKLLEECYDWILATPVGNGPHFQRCCYLLAAICREMHPR